MNENSIVSHSYPGRCYDEIGLGWEPEALAKPIGELFAENFNRLLQEKDMRPSHVARAVGVERSAVTGWRNGVPPTLPNLQKIADVFGVPIRELLEDPLDPKTIGIDVETALRVVVGAIKAVKQTKD